MRFPSGIRGAVSRPRTREVSALEATLLCLVLLARPAIAPAQSPSDTLRMSLAQCEERALALGEEILRAEATRSLAHARYLEARSSALPQLNFNALYTRQEESLYRQGGGIEPFEPDTTASLEDRIGAVEDALPGSGFYALDQLFTSSAFASRNSWALTLTLEQKVFQGGSIWASVSAAKHALRASELNRDDSREGVTFDVRTAYLNALLADRTLRIFELGLEQAENYLRRVRLRQENGAVSEFDLLQAEVERDNQVPPVSAAREARDLALLELRRLCNLTENAPIVLESRLLGDNAVPAEPLGVDTLGVTSDAMRAPGIQALEEALEARGHAVTVAAAGKYPELSLFANLSQLAFPADFFPAQEDWVREKSLGFRVSWSIFDGFLTKGAIHAAKAEESRTAQDLADARERMLETVTQARLELVLAADELHARSRTAGLAARALELANLRYEEGGSSLLEVSDARIAWQLAQGYEARARRDYFVALALLERVGGRPLFSEIAAGKDRP